MVACNGGGGGSTSSETANPDNGGNNQFNDPGNDQFNVPGGNNNPPPAVDVVETESMQITVEFDGEEAPLLYNYQEFLLGGKENVSVKIECASCQKLVVHKIEDFRIDGFGLYPTATEGENARVIEKINNEPLVWNEPINFGKSNFTVYGVYENEVRGHISYLRLNKNAEFVQPDNQVTCTSDQFNNRTINKHSNDGEGECLGVGSFNGNGYLDKEESLFHLVYFGTDPDNPQKEFVGYRLIDLKNNHHGAILQTPTDNAVINLYKNDMVIENNLSLKTGELGQHFYKDYPLPSLTRLDNGSLAVAFTHEKNKGEVNEVNRQLKVALYSLNTHLWDPVINNAAIEDRANIKKLKFSKRFLDGNVNDVLYLLHDDGSFYEIKFSENNWSSRELTLPEGFIPIDFDVDSNGAVTKFIFIKSVFVPVVIDGEAQLKEDRDIYFGKFNLDNQSQIDIQEVESCSGDGHVANLKQKNNEPISLHGPEIKIGINGAAYFKVQDKPNEWNTNLNTGQEHNIRTFFCLEDLETPSVNGEGFFDFKHLYHDALGKPIGGDVDFVIGNKNGEEYLDAFGKYWYKPYFSPVATHKHGLFTSHSDMYSTMPYLADGNNTAEPLKLDGFIGDPNYIFGHLQLYNNDENNIFMLFQNIKAVALNEGEEPDVSVCYQVPDLDMDGLNSFKETSSSLSDLNFNDLDLDSDNDGLQDYFELFLGLNPTKSDSDDDGQSDLDKAQQICSQ